MAARKLAPLLEAGAAVTVIAPDIDSALKVGVEAVTWIARSWRDGDVAGAHPRPWLVVAVTGVAAVDAAVAAEAEVLGVWCVRAAGHGSAALPGVVRDGPVVAALTTGAPALTAALRDRVAEAIAGSGPAAALLADLRDEPTVRAALAALDPATRRARWAAAVAAVLSELPAPADRIRSMLTGGPAHT